MNNFRCIATRKNKKEERATLHKFTPAHTCRCGERLTIGLPFSWWLPTFFGSHVGQVLSASCFHTLSQDPAFPADAFMPVTCLQGSVAQFSAPHPFYCCPSTSGKDNRNWHGKSIYKALPLLLGTNPFGVFDRTGTITPTFQEGNRLNKVLQVPPLQLNSLG